MDDRWFRLGDHGRYLVSKMVNSNPLARLPNSLVFHASSVIARYTTKCEFSTTKGESYVELNFSDNGGRSFRFFEVARERELELLAIHDDWDEATNSWTTMNFDGHLMNRPTDGGFGMTKLYNGKLAIICHETLFAGPSEIVITFDKMDSFNEFGAMADECFRHAGKYKRYKIQPKTR